MEDNAVRHQVAATLIICGTVFALQPSISDYFHGYQVSQFLAERTVQTGITRITPPLGEEFRVAAWVMGCAMIGAGVFSGSGGARSSEPIADVKLNSMFERDIMIDDKSRTA